MHSPLKVIASLIIGLLITVYLPTKGTAATVDWSWAYGTEELEFRWYDSYSSFDADIKITNEGALPISLAPYEIPAGFYYEGFYEFQSNLTEVVDTPIQPGETSYFTLGTWVPVGDGPAPYVNIEVQPKYLEVYYLDDNGDKHLSGGESQNRLQLTIHGAFNPIPYDDNNPGQGLIMYHPGIFWDSNCNDLMLGSPIYTPIPSSLFLFGNALLLLAYKRRAI